MARCRHDALESRRLSILGDSVIHVLAILRVCGPDVGTIFRELVGIVSSRACNELREDPATGSGREMLDKPTRRSNAAGFRSSSELSSFKGVRHFWQYIALTS